MEDIGCKNSVYVFIDASNLWEAQKAKGYLLDYQKVQTYLQKTYSPNKLKIFYYTAYPGNGTRSYSLDGRHKFFVFLDKALGFVVRKKELKRIPVVTEEGQTIKEKGNMDVEMTIDAVIHTKSYGTAIFFTGDSDFLALVTYLKNHGKNVYILSSENNVSEELRTGGNGYTDILRISDDIWGSKLKYRQSLSEKKAALRKEGCSRM